ncbi:MAG: CHAT domain-containing protein [Symploca sp. SIO2B6]|nr:CHAT domain-containing protein [Symploca sp. SIO2B6]
MLFPKIGLTLLAAISTPLIICSAAPLSKSTIAAQVQENSRQTQADQLFRQGHEQYQQGQLKIAIDFWEQALKIYQEIQNPKLEASILGNLGIAYNNLGEYLQAIDYHKQALVIMQEIGNRQGEWKVLLNLGNAYESLGHYEQVIAYYKQSLSIVEDINNREGEALILGNLGAIYAQQKDYTQAQSYYQQSLAIAQDINDQESQAYNFQNLGSSYYTQSVDYYLQGKISQSQAQEYVRKAREDFQNSLAIAKEINNRRLEGEVLVNLGMTHEKTGDYTSAFKYYQEGLAIAQALGRRRLEATALNNLGHALFNSGKLIEAETKVRQALEILESLRPGLPDADKVSIFDTQVSKYNLLQQILIAQGKIEEALEIAEQGRARAFVELIAQRLSPEAASEFNLKSQPPTIAQIKQIAQQHNATLVEYSLVPDHEFNFQGKQRGETSQLFIWVVQPTGKIDFRQVDLKEIRQEQKNTLTTLVKHTREAIGVGERSSMFLMETETPANPEAYLAKNLKVLHQLLIEPIADLLPTEEESRVIFIPQEDLFLVPFPALQDASEQYLIEKHTILSAPAIQVLALTHEQRKRVEELHANSLPNQNILVVGNPTMPTLKVGNRQEPLLPLQGAETEAIEIANLLGTQALIGDQATKTEIIKQLPSARLVHLATHGLLDEILESGIPGAIALAPSGNDHGFLTSREILELKLNAELVVLSACHTGEGKLTGDGVIGLSRSLIAAGTPSTIVSLWAVPDNATAVLMKEFYRNFQQNQDKAQALRQAMLATKVEHPSPKQWAAFTLIGEAD